VLSHPQGVFVHRDFHSRNIMFCEPLGIIDYQDAMNGSIVYDLVSLLKDLYIKFNPKDIEKLALYFKEQKRLKISDEEFLQWFDFMGLQRHIKVLGIFARLYIRDNKNGYLKDLPLTLEYVLESLKKYPELNELYEILSKVKLPCQPQI
jgi:aminoglycoside/choline kinase family phosphotransferase